MNIISTKFILAERFTFVPNNNSLIDQKNDNTIIQLGSNESRILLMLVQRPNDVVLRNELHDFVWRKQGFEVDDSSLTQAISTLRKMLNDSTKSPRYIKTIPKRGYQLIAEVEPIPAIKSSEPQQDKAEGSVTHLFQDEENTSLRHLRGEENIDLNNSQSTVQSSSEQADDAKQDIPIDSLKKKGRLDSGLNTKVILMLLIAFILPSLATFFNGPIKASFNPLTQVEGIPVNTPKNHPVLSSWLPIIQQCVKKYRNTQLEKKPNQIIATIGQNEETLVLNYIYPPEINDNNITVDIIANKEDFANICR
jgi:cholera toxin transcriptional activator